MFYMYFSRGRRNSCEWKANFSCKIYERRGRSYYPMEALFGRIRLYAVVDDLKYLRMGERLFSAGAMVGTPLGVKPIIGIEDGAEPKDGFRIKSHL